jgi:putative ABC transport system ATP-binding protein
MISFHNVTIAFNGTTVVRDFSLTVPQGEKVILYGDSGRGKTTLFRLLLGFIEPDTGSITFEGTPVDSRTAWEIRKKVAYVPQNTDIGEGLVRDVINRVFLTRENTDKQPSEAEITQIFSQLELSPETLEKNFGELSGGEKQRVVITIAVLLRRSIFFLDEITSALNERIKSTVIDFFLSRPEWTVLAVSHDAGRWDRDGSRIVKVG